MVNTCAWTTTDCGIDLRPGVYSGQSALSPRSGVFQLGLSRDWTQRDGLRQKPRERHEGVIGRLFCADKE
jgi:hypothetical protein